jgi:hypothetical protein
MRPVFWIALCVVVFLLYLIIPPAITPSGGRGEFTIALSNSKQIARAISAYQSDESASGQDWPMPTIPLLLKRQYLEQRVFDSMQQSRGMYCFYLCPDMKPDDVLIEYYRGNNITQMKVNGEGRVYPKRQFENLQK